MKITKVDKPFDVPILLIVFRREDCALRVLDAISKVKPQRLYISQDGPRNNIEKNEILKIKKSIISKINWKCDLEYWSHEENLGLKKHIPEAFDKFFEKEEFGIYLEDDTLPSKDFFYFQKELLQKYKDDLRIFSINGTNFYPEVVKANESYYLSEIGDIWGFGLWKRSWELYSSGMEDFSYVTKTSDYDKFFFSSKYKYYLETFWKAITKNKLDSWAMQIIYTAMKNKMYFITPKVNMVNNIGINNTASNISIQNYHHTFGNFFPVNHPDRLTYDKRKDVLYFRNMLRGGWIRILLIRIYLFAPDSLKLMINKFIKLVYS